MEEAHRIAEEWKAMSKTAEEFSPYDSADYLYNIGDAAAYLEAALERGDDAALVAQALGTIARSGNISQLARRVGMSREGIYKALSADGNPSFATVFKVTKSKALGLKLHFESAACIKKGKSSPAPARPGCGFRRLLRKPDTPCRHKRAERQPTTSKVPPA